MVDKNKQLKVSLGIFVGYVIAALINVLFFDKDFIEALTDIKLIFLFTGILISFWLINRRKK
jgi:hypothetical protein